MTPIIGNLAIVLSFAIVIGIIGVLMDDKDK